MYNDSERVCPFVALDIIYNHVWLHINANYDYKMYTGKNGMYGSKVGSVCQFLFVPEWQVTVTNVLVGKFLPVK